MFASNLQELLFSCFLPITFTYLDSLHRLTAAAHLPTLKATNPVERTVRNKAI